MERVEENEPLSISLNSVQPKTMKLVGKIELEVVLTIDPGATHNSMSPKMVKRIGRSFERYDNFGVMLGNGQEIIWVYTHKENTSTYKRRIRSL